MGISITTVSLLLLLVFSFVFSSFLKNKFGKTSLLGGLEYILIGVFVSQEFGVGLFGPDQFNAFIPLIYLIIGLFGFLLGIEMNKVSLKNEQMQLGMMFYALLIILASIVFFYICILLFPEYANFPDFIIGRENFRVLGQTFQFEGTDTHLWVALTLASMVVLSSKEEFKNILNRFSISEKISSILNNLVISGEIFGIMLFGSVFAAFRAVNSASTLGWTVTEWTVAIFAIGVGFAFLFWLFVGKNFDNIRTYLATIGIITLASGVAVSIGVSPLFLSFICGATLGLSSSNAKDIEFYIFPLRGPLSIMMLFFAGTMLKPIDTKDLILAAFYIVARIFFIYFIAKITFYSLKIKSVFHQNIGRIFWPQDILIVVLAIDLSIRNIGFSNVILNVSVLGYLIFGLFGSMSTKRLMIDLQEK